MNNRCTEALSHTPGPWLREGSSVYALQQEGHRKGVPFMVNRFYAQVQTGRANGALTPHEEIEANARLIAAAPELLAAMLEILSRFDDDDLKLTVDAIQASRAVVKKALGQS